VTVSDWHLLDEREFLRRSLEDAAREHEAGDLSDADYALLRRRDEERLAEVDAQLATVSPAPTSAAPGAPSGGEAATTTPALRRRPAGARRRWRRMVFWRRRWWVAAVGVALVVAAAVLLVVDLTSPRLPGEDATGSVNLNTAQTIEQQLAQARLLVQGRKDVAALRLYGEVLAEDPRQPVALAEWGWLDWQAASREKEPTIAAEGASALVEAVKVDPHLYAAQYYLGTVLLQEGDPAKAVAHYERFLADRPGASWERRAAPEIRTAFAALHRPPPAGLPG
jgi:tetratricopeptide (TPR) repeat protein